MDILVSSNLERLLYYVCGEEHTVKYMQQLQESGEYRITPEELAEIQSVFVGLAASDADGSAAIGREYKNDNYLMDTHTAIAWSCYEQYRQSTGDTTPNVVLSTASPYKFCASVLKTLGETVGTDRENMDLCNSITGAPIPSGLAGIFEREIKHTDVIAIDDMRDYVISRVISRGRS